MPAISDLSRMRGTLSHASNEIFTPIPADDFNPWACFHPFADGDREPIWQYIHNPMFFKINDQRPVALALGK